MDWWILKLSLKILMQGKIELLGCSFCALQVICLFVCLWTVPHWEISMELIVRTLRVWGLIQCPRHYSRALSSLFPPFWDQIVRESMQVAMSKLDVPRTQQANLPALSSHCPLWCWRPRWEAVHANFLKSLAWPDTGIKPASTASEADALSTTLWRLSNCWAS